jgi:hypothetical protein
MMHPKRSPCFDAARPGAAGVPHKDLRKSHALPASGEHDGPDEPADFDHAALHRAHAGPPALDSWVSMSANATPESVKHALAVARAEEAEALRRAIHLRAIAPLDDIRDAMREVDRLHSRMASLQLLLRKLRSP